MNVFLVVTSTTIIVSWLAYLLQVSLSHAQQQVRAGTHPNKVRGLHIFPIFPIMPAIVCLCLWSFQPPLSLLGVGSIFLVHVVIAVFSTQSCLRSWQWLLNEESKSRKSS